MKFGHCRVESILDFDGLVQINDDELYSAYRDYLLFFANNVAEIQKIYYKRTKAKRRLQDVWGPKQLASHDFSPRMHLMKSRCSSDVPNSSPEYRICTLRTTTSPL